MITITFYKLQKKPNSTLLPSGAGFDLSCDIIDNNNIISPRIRVKAPANFLTKEYNYVYIPDFNRYYFVVDIIWELGTWVYSLNIDVLATYKTQIGASSQYVRRCSNTFDGTITDTLYPIKNAYVQEKVVESTHTLFAPASEMTAWYVVGIIEGMSSEMEAYFRNTYNVNPDYIYNGSVVYYVLDASQLRELMSMLLGSDSIYGIPAEEISSALAKQLLNPIQYIESVRCVPFKPACVVDSTSYEDARIKKVQFGFSIIDVPGGGSDVEPEPGDGDDPEAVSDYGWRILARPSAGRPLRIGATNEGWIHMQAFTMRLPVHPQSGDRGAWVLGKPTSAYTIEVEPFGMIDIPGSVPIKASKFTLQEETYFYIRFNTWFDVVTGKLKMHIYYEGDNDTWFLFYNETTDASVVLPCHQSIQDASSYFRAWTNLDARSEAVGPQAVSSIFGGVQGSVGVSGQDTVSGGINDKGQAHGYAGSTDITRQGIGLGTGLVGGIMNAGTTVSNYYRAEKPQMQLSMLEANMPRISGTGSTSGSLIEFASDFCAPIVHCYFSIICDDNNPDNGRPLCQIRQLSTIPGFIQCEDAHFSSFATARENLLVMDALNGGFYYE